MATSGGSNLKDIVLEYASPTIHVEGRHELVTEKTDN